MLSLAEQKNASDAVLEATQRTLGSLSEAHQRLAEAFSMKQFEVEAIVQQLVADGKRLEAFYKDLDKKSSK